MWRGVFRCFVRTTTALTILLVAASEAIPMSPTPPVRRSRRRKRRQPTFTSCLGGDLGPDAFGDHPIVIFKGERMRSRDIDAAEHDLVTDTTSLPEFMATGPLGLGDERSFLMNTIGTTKFHCTIHPQMVGALHRAGTLSSHRIVPT